MWITIAFVVVLLMITFLSNTLVNLHVPRVEVDFTQRRIIQSSAVSSGILRPADAERMFVIEAAFPLIHDFITEGLPVDITVGTARHEGRTGRIQPDGAWNIVTIEVESGTLQGGELAHVIVAERGEGHHHTIPLSALRQDMNGYFILYVNSARRFFGSNYYANILRIEVQARDHIHAAIFGDFGIDWPQKAIIINSDIPVHVGDSVRLVGGSELTPATR